MSSKIEEGNCPYQQACQKLAGINSRLENIRYIAEMNQGRLSRDESREAFGLADGAVVSAKAVSCRDHRCDKCPLL